MASFTQRQLAHALANKCKRFVGQTQVDDPRNPPVAHVLPLDPTLGPDGLARWARSNSFMLVSETDPTGLTDWYVEPWGTCQQEAS